MAPVLTHGPVRAYGGIEVRLHVFVTLEENGFYGRIYILYLYRRTKSPCYQLDRRLVKPKIRCEHGSKEKGSSPVVAQTRNPEGCNDHSQTLRSCKGRNFIIRRWVTTRFLLRRVPYQAVNNNSFRCIILTWDVILSLKNHRLTNAENEDISSYEEDDK